LADALINQSSFMESMRKAAKQEGAPAGAEVISNAHLSMPPDRIDPS
jgi:hypothetical protein